MLLLMKLVFLSSYKIGLTDLQSIDGLFSFNKKYKKSKLLEVSIYPTSDLKIVENKKKNK